MQGRLSPPEDGRFQSFPRESWRAEIARAKDAGLEYIEWIHDEYGRTANPIFSEAGLAEMDALKSEFGIATPALCGDWFMDFPLVRCSAEELVERERHLHALIPVAKRIGAGKIVLPFVDQSKMTDEAEKAQVRAVLLRALPVAEQYGVELHLEADFGPEELAEFLASVEHPMLKVNWDSGNSSGWGSWLPRSLRRMGSGLARCILRTAIGSRRAGLRHDRSGRGRRILRMCSRRSEALGMKVG